MDRFIGKEVFVIVPEEDTSSEIKVYDDFEDAMIQLSEVDPLEFPETKVFHGVIAKAETIPADINTRGCYIIAIDIYYDPNRFRGILYESDCKNDPDTLANDIEMAIESSIHEPGNLYTHEIEFLYILYGYEVTTGLCINKDSLDEEIVHTCKTIAVEAMKMSEEYINN